MSQPRQKVESVLLVGAALVVEVPLEKAKPLRHARSHRLFDAGSVPFELGEDERGDEQLEISVEREKPDGNDPLLTVSPLGEVQPRGRVDQQMKHGKRLPTPSSGRPRSVRRQFGGAGPGSASQP